MRFRKIQIVGAITIMLVGMSSAVFAFESSLVINAGVGGNNTYNILDRLDSDVLSHQPDLVVMMVGTNDMLNSSNSVPLDQYEANLTQLIQRITNTGSQLAMMTVLPCYEPYLLERHPASFYGDDGPNGRVELANEVIQQVATTYNIPVIDTHTLFDLYGNVGDTVDSLIRNEANCGVRDGVHPTPEGYVLIGNAIADAIDMYNLPTSTVVCVGDSITYGVHVEGEGTATGETYPGVLSRQLNIDPRTRITTADGDGADAYVHWFSNIATIADQNNGGSGVVEVKNAGDLQSDYMYRKGYFRFDLSDIDPATVTDATFELTVGTSSSDQTFSVYGLNDGNADETWIEGTSASNLNVLTDSDPSNDDWITWNNAPGNASGNGVDPSEATLLGTFTGDVNGETVGISGSALLDFLAADTDGLVTLIVTRETHDSSFYGTSHSFAASEHPDTTKHPSLLLEIDDTPAIPGDANGDGRVDGSDVTILAGNWQYGVGMSEPDGTYKMGDFNGDGCVDGSDVTILAGNWQYGTTSPSVTVPEPSEVLLLTIMLAGLIIYFVRRAFCCPCDNVIDHSQK